MVSAPTLHVVTTELAVGSFALAGVSFLLAGLGSHHLFGLKRSLQMADHVAHAALAFGLLAMPFAIITGIQSSPGDGLDHPVLINKMLLGSSAFGLALGVLLARRKHGHAIWSRPWGRRWQTFGGLGSVGLVLLTASLGGTFSRGESLLDVFNLPYDTVPLMPIWLSGFLLVAAISNLALMRRQVSA
ncbi:MAG: hypothetical protein VW982_01825 [Candidatus Poseidoniales archaeon]